MKQYTAKDLLVLAKRYNNTKRTYLLVDPLQAKHMPVSPTKSLEMMDRLGETVADAYPSAKLVIGFAETATAIGAAVAARLDSDCVYIHTTREPCDGLTDWIYFKEEHSHAVEQKLYCGDLRKYISDSPRIIFADDEISTGKTLINIIKQLREAYPEIKEKQLVAASVINRLSQENEERLAAEGIEIKYLVRLSDCDYAAAVEGFDISAPLSPDDNAEDIENSIIHTDRPFLDPRSGVNISEYADRCRTEAENLANMLMSRIQTSPRVLVLGTEECMYPALILGREIEKLGISGSVKCHSTTRSPIGICSDKDYPIHSGYMLHSFFADDRDTYIYDLESCDIAIIVTDAAKVNPKARTDISKALASNGCRRIVFIEGGKGGKGGKNVQYI